MARRREAEKREIQPDPKYGSLLVSRFINYLMVKGKKSVAERNFYKAMDEVGEKTKEDPISVFNQALENARPILEVKSRRVGGATYQVPVEVPQNRQNTLAIRWIISSARKRKGMSINFALTNEIMDAYQKTGPVMKKREETHKMAESNRAFSHFRW